MNKFKNVQREIKEESNINSYRKRRKKETQIGDNLALGVKHLRIATTGDMM